MNPVPPLLLCLAALSFKVCAEDDPAPQPASLPPAFDQMVVILKVDTTMRESYATDIFTEFPDGQHLTRRTSKIPHGMRQLNALLVTGWNIAEVMPLNVQADSEVLVSLLILERPRPSKVTTKKQE